MLLWEADKRCCNAEQLLWLAHVFLIRKSRFRITVPMIDSYVLYCLAWCSGHRTVFRQDTAAPTYPCLNVRRFSVKVTGKKNKKALHLERPFGGLNVVVSGDAWQFGPIGSVGAVYDNYLRLPTRASLRDISAMFWKREKDSFNCFTELTVERRCKDPWLWVFYLQRFNH